MYNYNANTSPFYVPNQPQKQFSDFSVSEKVSLPFDKIVVPEHTFIIDSRQRDPKLYPSPSFYRIELGTVYKNITSVELKGAIIPRTSYNVHSTNKYIDFSIGSTITNIILKYGGAGYTFVPNVTLTPPASGGVQATAVAITNLISGQITGITITNPGSGYNSVPTVMISSPTGNRSELAIATAVVGTAYTAYLREGQYVIGGNPSTVVPISTVPSDLILEIQDAMNFAVNGLPYVQGSTGPFTCRLVSQYPDLYADAGQPEAFNTNATLFNRIQITNSNSSQWSLLWASGPNNDRNAHNLMGFAWCDQSNVVSTPAVSGLMVSGTSLRAQFDYNLLDSPDYVIIKFWSGSDAFERLESEESTLNRAFASMFFNSSGPNVLTDTEGLIDTSNGINYLNGPVTKGNFWLPGIYNIGIRGIDYDVKKLEFSPSIGKLSSLTIDFCKFGIQNGGTPEKYNFSGRDHLLIFGIKSSDFQSGQNQ